MNVRTVSLVFALCLSMLVPGTLLLSAPKVVEKERGRVWHVVVDRVPATLDEFRAFRDAIAKTPQGGIVVYLVAHLIMIEKPELGEQCLVIALDKGELAKGAGRRPSVEGWQIGSSESYKLQTSSFQNDREYVAKSFIEGTSTAAGYALPALPYRYVIRPHAFQDRDPNIWKGLVNTSCHDMGYVPIFVKKNDKGIWKVYNSSSFYSGCKDPVKPDNDDL